MDLQDEIIRLKKEVK